ncbi:MAG: hypothetical protein QME71_09700 [Dehalococcoidia bacterium]|nr:hypothetical protein [Dehalococcoidia bacterium]
MWLHLYVQEVLREREERMLERTLRVRRELPPRAHPALRPARLLGLALISVGTRLCAWGGGDAVGPQATPSLERIEGAVRRRAARG